MKLLFVTMLTLFIAVPSVSAALPPVGAAPKGDAKVVATRIIKDNFPSCKRVSSASRMSDGSIRATCDSTDYLVFTIFDANEGETLEIALNCAAAKDLLNISC